MSENNKSNKQKKKMFIQENYINLRKTKIFSNQVVKNYPILYPSKKK